MNNLENEVTYEILRDAWKKASPNFVTSSNDDMDKIIKEMTFDAFDSMCKKENIIAILNEEIRNINMMQNRVINEKDNDVIPETPEAYYKLGVKAGRKAAILSNYAKTKELLIFAKNILEK